VQYRSIGGSLPSLTSEFPYPFSFYYLHLIFILPRTSVIIQCLAAPLRRLRVSHQCRSTCRSTWSGRSQPPIFKYPKLQVLDQPSLHQTIRLGVPQIEPDVQGKIFQWTWHKLNGWTGDVEF
jgi:hypothetical protein